MNKLLWHRKLQTQFIICVTLAFLSSIVFFTLMQYGASIGLNLFFTKTQYELQKEKESIADLQRFINAHVINSASVQEINTWVAKKKHVMLYLYQNDHMIYDSNQPNVIPDASLTYYINTEERVYELQFTDSAAMAVIHSFFEYSYYTAATFISLGLSFLFFLSILVAFLRTKVKYLHLLKKQMDILESGDLEYPITVKGCDEISMVGRGLEEMRRSFIVRLKNEEEARNANSALITAMSHDLRTPLTALIGYLEIIDMQKYQNQEQFEQYMHNSKEKAYQIKALSDKLFEYFLVYGKDYDALEFQTLDGKELMDQIVQEHIFNLEDHGFKVMVNDSPQQIYQLYVNVNYIRRVFDNVFSNILKYADQTRTVDVNFKIRGKVFYVIILNGINRKATDVESTRIGLATCERILQHHNGSFKATKLPFAFKMTIRLPIV